MQEKHSKKRLDEFEGKNLNNDVPNYVEELYRYYLQQLRRAHDPLYWKLVSLD